jgi:hypothetical protein
VTPSRDGSAVIGFPSDLDILITREFEASIELVFDVLTKPEHVSKTVAVESVDLHETHGVTTLTYRLAFRDKAGRDHMTRFDGIEANFDDVEDLLRSLLDAKGTSSG